MNLENFNIIAGALHGAKVSRGKLYETNAILILKNSNKFEKIETNIKIKLSTNGKQKTYSPDVIIHNKNDIYIIDVKSCGYNRNTAPDDFIRKYVNAKEEYQKTTNKKVHFMFIRKLCSKGILDVYKYFEKEYNIKTVDIDLYLSEISGLKINIDNFVELELEKIVLKKLSNYKNRFTGKSPQLSKENLNIIKQILEIS